MVSVTKLNGEQVLINPDLLRLVEKTPDTVLIFLGNERLMVKESPSEITQKILEFKKSYIGSVVTKYQDLQVK